MLPHRFSALLVRTLQHLYQNVYYVRKVPTVQEMVSDLQNLASWENILLPKVKLTAQFVHLGISVMTQKLLRKLVQMDFIVERKCLHVRLVLMVMGE